MEAVNTCYGKAHSTLVTVAVVSLECYRTSLRDVLDAMPNKP